MNVRQLITSREAGLTALTLVLFVAITSQLPQFASLQSLRGLIDDTALLLLLSLGEMLVILRAASTSRSPRTRQADESRQGGSATHSVRHPRSSSSVPGNNLPTIEHVNGSLYRWLPVTALR